MKIFIKVFLLLVAGIFAWAEEFPAMDDAEPKKNFPYGQTTNIRDVGALFERVGFTVSPETPYIVLLSDLHIFLPEDDNRAGDNIYKRPVREDLSALIDTINRFAPAPALVLITGDLTHYGTAAQYEYLKRELARLNPDIPVMLIPGNHDEYSAFAKVFGKMPTEMQIGPVRVIGLYTGKSGTFSEAELAKLQQALAAQNTAPVIIATHHSPVQKPGDENMLELRENILKAIKQSKSSALLVNGHAHANFLCNFTAANLKPVPNITHTSSTSSFGYDHTALRVLMLDKNGLVGSALLRYREPGTGFRIDPAPQKYPQYNIPALNDREVLLKLNSGNFQEYASTFNKVGLDPRYAYMDCDAELTLAIPVGNFADCAPLALEITIESDYVVKIGAIPGELPEVFNSQKRKPVERLVYDIPAELNSGVLYVNITDRTANDGFGAFVRSVNLIGSARGK